MWKRESKLYAPPPRPTYTLSLLVPSFLLSISEVASPGPGCSAPFPPPGRVWLKVTAVIPHPLPRGCRCCTVLSAAGFVFHSLLFLGILCSIKPACNTAGRAPSRSSRLPFLSASASRLLQTGPYPAPLAPYCVPTMLNSLRVEEWLGWRFRHLPLFLVPSFPRLQQRCVSNVHLVPRRKIQVWPRCLHRGSLPMKAGCSHPGKVRRPGKPGPGRALVESGGLT